MTNEEQINREGDVVLVHYQDKAAAYARIEAIESDIKKDWYQVTLLLLTMPAQAVTWILREEYINGDSFTMGGQPVTLEKVKRVPALKEPDEEDPVREHQGKKGAEKVIPFKKK